MKGIMRRMTEKKFMLPNRKAFEVMISYIPYFKNPKNEFYEIKVTDYFYSKKIIKFIDDFYKNKFDYPFDWTKWTDNFWELSNNKESFDNADIETVIMFLSTIINADRFIEGTMAFAIDNGHILAILEKFRKHTMNIKE